MQRKLYSSNLKVKNKKNVVILSKKKKKELQTALAIRCVPN